MASRVIELALTRIGSMRGVEGYVIVDGAGQILRQSKGLSEDVAEQYAVDVPKLTIRAQHMVRDLEPTDQLQVFRLRMRNGLEIVAAPADDCFIIVIQRWVVGSGGVGSGIEESDGATGAT